MTDSPISFLTFHFPSTIVATLAKFRHLNGHAQLVGNYYENTNCFMLCRNIICFLFSLFFSFTASSTSPFFFALLWCFIFFLLLLLIIKFTASLIIFHASVHISHSIFYSFNVSLALSLSLITSAFTEGLPEFNRILYKLRFLFLSIGKEVVANRSSSHEWNINWHETTGQTKACSL